MPQATASRDHRAAQPFGCRCGADPIATKLTVTTFALLLMLAGFGVYSELRFRDFSRGLDAQLATFKRYRWDRPPLRNQGPDGNAAAAEAKLLQQFVPLTPLQREGIASQLYYGQPFNAEQNALLEERAAWVAKLREATELTWAASEQGLVPPDPAFYPKVIDAALVLLATGARGPADECLAVCTDAIRFGQDLVPGATLEAASVSMRITSITSRLMPFCAQKASIEALSRATRELRTLATHAPPTGGGVELADLVAGERLRELGDLLATDPESTVITRLRRRPALFAAWQYFDNPARWREIRPDRYPQALETFQHEQEWRSHADLQLVADATAQVADWLSDDMRGQALVRALTVAIATRAERMRRGRAVREAQLVADPGLRDPFNGQLLRWRILPDGSDLTVWSVGEDLRDDKGSGDWTSQAPVDVVVHIALRSAREAEVARD